MPSKFKVGDKAIYLGTKDNDRQGTWHEYFGQLGVQRGDECEITSIDPIYTKDAIRGSRTSGYLIEKDLMTTTEWNSYNTQINNTVKLKGGKKKMAITNPKIGDKIIVTAIHEGEQPTGVGVVKHVSDTGTMSIEFLEWGKGVGHSCDGHCKEPFGWRFKKEQYNILAPFTGKMKKIKIVEPTTYAVMRGTSVQSITTSLTEAENQQPSRGEKYTVYKLVPLSTIENKLLVTKVEKKSKKAKEITPAKV